LLIFSSDEELYLLLCDGKLKEESKHCIKVLRSATMLMIARGGGSIGGDVDDERHYAFRRFFSFSYPSLFCSPEH
jgi:hypothetical protein